MWPRVATCFIPAQPTEDFLGWDALPEERACFRWHVLQRYPHGVPISEGEAWFLETHAPELCALSGLRRFFSSRVINEPLRLPGVWADGKEPPPETILPVWHRLSELWFESLSDWRAAFVESASRAHAARVGDPAGLSLRGARPRLRQLVPAGATDRRVPARPAGVPAVSAGTTAPGAAAGVIRPQVRPHHVGISVADLEASVAWYEEFLGFSLEAVVPVPEDEGRVPTSSGTCASTRT